MKKRSLNNTLEELDDSNNEESEGFIINIGSHDGLEKVECSVGNIALTFIIDSGSPVNIITSEYWSQFDKSLITDINYECTKRFFGYGQREPLTVVAEFKSEIIINVTKVKSIETLYVIEEAKRCLLGRSTSQRLQVLKIGIINEVAQDEEFPKIPNLQVRFIIDESVPPVKVLYLRMATAIDDKVDDKIDEFERWGIMEYVKKGAQIDWISQLMAVLKKDGDIRLVVNMKNVNKAMKREHYPMPVIEDVA